MDDFLFYPERLVGYPITIEEARRKLNRDRYDTVSWASLSGEETRKGYEQAKLFLWWCLAAGDLHSFAQAHESGAWYRLPAGYWIDHRQGFAGLFASIESEELTEHVERRPFLGTVPDELIGSPIVVWRDDVSALLSRLPDQARAYLDLLPLKAPEGQQHETTSHVASGHLVSSRTGGAGRPTSKHLIARELHRRHAAGLLATGLAEESRQLAQWFSEQPEYAGMPQPTCRTIENNIRETFAVLRRQPSV